MKQNQKSCNRLVSSSRCLKKLNANLCPAKWATRTGSGQKNCLIFFERKKIPRKKINFFNSCIISGRQKQNCWTCMFGEDGACPIRAVEEK